MPDSAYDSFADDYHWLFPDEHLTGQRFLELYGPVLEHTKPGAEVLDCACGVGIEAMTLARAGFSVTASDGSEGMVAVARREIEEAGLEIPVTHCTWDELPGQFGPQFDVAFCIGNSIAHTSGPEAMMAAFTGMHRVLVPGGKLVVESRDWELMRAEGWRIEVRDHAVVRDGVRGFCMFVWTIPESWSEDHVAEVVVVLERDGGVTHRSVELRFRPYRREELVARLEEAGFELAEEAGGRRGRYFVTARKSP